MRTLIIVLFLGLVACGTRTQLAPVSEISWRDQHVVIPQTYRVVRGDTLYSIAFRYDQDYLQIARYNHLRPPYSLRVGQRLRLVPIHGRKTKVSQHVQSSYGARHLRFQWPLRGQLLHGFAPLKGQKGIDIRASQGTKVRAAAEGEVAYAGSGLRGYGQLIIIKHDRQYLTAYGNNAQYFVREGQHVRAGEVIGEVGRIERRFWGLHFEIRRAGKPVNPLIYLKNR